MFVPQYEDIRTIESKKIGKFMIFSLPIVYEISFVTF